MGREKSIPCNPRNVTLFARPQQHCTEHGVMIAFKFGSIVYVQPRRRTMQREFLTTVPDGQQQGAEAAGPSGSGGIVAGGVPAEGPDARSTVSASRATERSAVAAAALLQQELTRAVRTAVTDPVLTKARMEGARSGWTCALRVDERAASNGGGSESRDQLAGLSFLLTCVHWSLTPVALCPLSFIRGPRDCAAGHAATVRQGAGPRGGSGAGSWQPGRDMQGPGAERSAGLLHKVRLHSRMMGPFYYTKVIFTQNICASPFYTHTYRYDITSCKSQLIFLLDPTMPLSLSTKPPLAQRVQQSRRFSARLRQGPGGVGGPCR